jgi:hypothetical protein
MKLLFDHNLPPSLVVRLADLFPQSQHVFPLGLDRANDLEIREYARQNGLLIVTKDVDFSDLLRVARFPAEDNLDSARKLFDTSALANLARALRCHCSSGRRSDKRCADSVLRKSHGKGSSQTGCGLYCVASEDIDVQLNRKEKLIGLWDLRERTAACEVIVGDFQFLRSISCERRTNAFDGNGFVLWLSG